MKKILGFLKELHKNNNREWFLEHKDEWLEVQKAYHVFADELIERIGTFDESVRGLTAKDCTYRIYRDVRFSKDKSPYKSWLGVYVCRGGKKSGFSGYYFQISAANGTGFDGHMLAAGDYCAEPKVLKTIREDIINGDGDFDDIIRHQIDPHFQLSSEFQLKRVPQGFPADSPYSNYLKYKVYSIDMQVDDDFILAPHLAQRVAELFYTTKPFLDYINRAIEYVKEEGI